MKIQKGSWHYRLIDFFNFQHPDNLCAYFWQVGFAGVVGIGVFFALVPMIIFIVLSPIIALVLHFLIGPAQDSIIFQTATVVMMVSCVAAVIFGVPWIYKKSRDGFSTIEVPDNIVVEYVKAKHRKICPLLDFE